MPTEILSVHYRAFTLAHTAATTAKSFLLIGGKPVMPLNTAAANDSNVFVSAADAVRVPKAAAQAWVPLEPIYWHDTNKNFTNILTGATLAGRVAESAASADTEGVITLNPDATAA